MPNDVEADIYTDKPKIEFFTEYTDSYNSSDWLTEYSELWMLLKRKVSQQWRAKAYLDESLKSYQDDSAKWNRCRESLLEIHSICEQNNIPLAVVIWPFFVGLDGDYPFVAIHEQVINLCNERDIPVLDLKDHMGPVSGPEFWVHPLDQHPNEMAHQISAEEVAQFLQEQQLLATAKTQTSSESPRK